MIFYVVFKQINMNPFLLHIELVRYSKMDENDTVTDVGKGSKEFSCILISSSALISLYYTHF